MTDVSTYSIGTVAISANGTTVAGSGSNWTGLNAMSGDTLSVAGFGQTKINSVTDATTLVIDAWPFGAVTAGTAYSIKKDSPLRFVGAQTAVAVDQMVTAINTNGFYVFVGSDETVPDPSLDDNDQYALKATTGQIWQKECGVWTFVGTFKWFGTPAPWDSATAYVAFDVVSFEGTSYVCIEANTNEQPSSGDSPPNAFWTVLAAQGEAATVTVGTVTTGAGGSSAAVTNSGTTGAAVLDFTIPAGEGYGGTSTTSLAIGTGSKAFTTQSGLAYTAGARVRAPVPGPLRDRGVVLADRRHVGLGRRRPVESYRRHGLSLVEVLAAEGEGASRQDLPASTPATRSARRSCTAPC